MANPGEIWPPLPLGEWRDTCETLHMWTQVVGKVRLKLSPMTNHWWQVPLYVTSRGLTTSPMPYGHRTLEMEFDFTDHRLLFSTSDGARAFIALEPKSVAAFYHEVMATLTTLDMPVTIWPMPVEVENPTPFDEDHAHASYASEAAHRFWRILVQSDRVFKQFRARFLGKNSPVHFFWGSFDLAVSRYSGREAPARAGADAVTREAYSHEVSSVGFWPGSGPFPEPAFYAYASPEPDGFKGATVRPAAAFYHAGMSEFLLRYDDVRNNADPDGALLDFMQSTYDAAADLGHWDRTALERSAE